MKTNLIRIIFGLLTVIFLLSFNDPYLKKRITDKQFRYEFYTTNAKIRPKANVMYYWFKAGSIHFSEEGISGELLDDQYDKFYLSNQLAERGCFRKGKKIGIWRTWFENGIISSQEEWSGGGKNGLHFSYNDKGQLTEKGLYRGNKKQGKWINYETKDTVQYKNDVIVVKKLKRKSESKKNKITNDSIANSVNKVTPKESASDNRKKAKKLVNQNKAKKTNSLSNQSKSKKDNFFKRLFSKKEKTKKSDDKGS